MPSATGSDCGTWERKDIRFNLNGFNAAFDFLTSVSPSTHPRTDVTSRTSASSAPENLTGTPRAQSALSKIPSSFPLITDLNLYFPEGDNGNCTIASAA